MPYTALFAGLTTVDIQYHVDEFPVANVKLKADPPDILVGGPVTNAAVAFAKLNGTAHLLSSVGKNAFNEIITEDFKETKLVHIDLAGGRKSAPVLATVVTSKYAGDRNIFTHDPVTPKTDLDPKDLIDRIMPQIVMLDGFYPEFCIELAKVASERNIPVVLDCGSWKPQYEKMLSHAETVICSADFIPPGCLTSIEAMQFLRDAGVINVAVSRGEESILFDGGKGINEIKVDKVEAVDTLGAGDFLHGAFCFYALKLGNFENALRAASQLATLSCKFKGTREWLNSNIVVKV